MRRREFISLLCAAALWPCAARATQQGEPLRRIGVLMNRAADDPLGQVGLAAFQRSLQQLGWGEGRDVRMTPAGAKTMQTSFANMRRNWSRLRRTSSWLLAPWAR